MQKSKVKTDEIPVCAGMMKRQKAKVGRIEGPMHFPASENPVTFDF
jgi:phage FluMu protein gp41